LAGSFAIFAIFAILGDFFFALAENGELKVPDLECRHERSIIARATREGTFNLDSWHGEQRSWVLREAKAARTEGVESTEQSSTTIISSRLEIFRTFCIDLRDRSLFIENRYYDASPRSDGQAQVRTPIIPQ
jgi:hypothetical protein